MIYRGYDIEKRPDGQWYWKSPEGNFEGGPFASENFACDDVERHRRTLKELLDE